MALHPWVRLGAHQDRQLQGLRLLELPGDQRVDRRVDQGDVAWAPIWGDPSNIATGRVHPVLGLGDQLPVRHGDVAAVLRINRSLAADVREQVGPWKANCQGRSNQNNNMTAVKLKNMSRQWQWSPCQISNVKMTMTICQVNWSSYVKSSQVHVNDDS